MKALIHHILTAINRINRMWRSIKGRRNEVIIDTGFTSSIELQKSMMAQNIERLKQQEMELERILSTITQKQDETDKANKLEAIKAAHIAETYKQAVNKLVAEYKAVWEELVRLKASNDKDTIKQNIEDEK